MDDITKLDFCCSFTSLKLRQLASKLRSLKKDRNLWETFHKKLSVSEEEKLVALMNVLEIETKVQAILPVERQKEGQSDKAWGQLVIWTPPQKKKILQNNPDAVEFEEAGS